MSLRRLFVYNPLSVCFLKKCSSYCAFETLQKELKGITVVGLNQPQNKNALSKGLVRSLYEVFERISSDVEARVVILRSLVPGVFCAGADLKERLAMTENEVKHFRNQLNELVFKIENCPIPVIAAIDGSALGGGLEIALACDIRVAAESAKIGLVETKLAILPGAGGTQRLPRLIGTALAKELIFTGRIISGKLAAQYGIVNHYTNPVTPQELDPAYQKCLNIASEILPNGPVGVKLAKLAINKGTETSIYNGCEVEGLCYAQVIPTDDRIEGLKAFAEKRKPNYKGA